MSSDFIGYHYLSGRRALTQSALPVNKTIVNVVRIFMNWRRGNTAPSIMKVPLMALSKNVFSWKSPRLPGRQPRGFIFKIFRFRADSHRTSASLCLFRQSQTGDNGVHRKNGLPVRTLQRYAFNLKLPRFSTPKFAAYMLQERHKRFFSPLRGGIRP